MSVLPFPAGGPAAPDTGSPPLVPDEAPGVWASDEAEQAVLGACLLGQPGTVATVRALLAPADFHRTAHGAIWSAILACDAAGAAVDVLTVAEAITRAGGEPALAAAGGRSFLELLVDVIPTAAHVVHHAQIVKADAQRRRLATLGAALVRAAGTRGADVSALAQRAAGDLVPFAADVAHGGYVRGDDAVREWLDALEARQEAAKAGRLPGIPFGWPEIDDVVHGGRKGELVVPAAAPKMGKSTAGLGIVREALWTGHRCAMVAAEMTRTEVVEAMLSAEAYVERARLASGRLWDDDHPRLARALGAWRKPMARFHIDDDGFPRLDDVVARATALKAEHPDLDVLLVDYLQLVTHRMTGRRGDEELAHVCRTLKGLAKRLDVLVIAPAQTNYKESARRESKRPTLEDLQGGSAIAQQANLVMLLYRPAEHDPSQPETTLEVELVGRRVPRTMVTLGWDGKHARVYSPRLAARDARTGTLGSRGPVVEGAPSVGRTDYRLAGAGDAREQRREAA